MATAYINFGVDKELKRKYDLTFPRIGFTGLAESLRSYMREIVNKHYDPSFDVHSPSVADQHTKPGGGVSTKKQTARSA